MPRADRPAVSNMGPPTLVFERRAIIIKGAVRLPMNTVVKIQPKDVGSIPYQEASFDIWDKKYRLTSKDGSPIDKSMDEIGRAHV